MKRITLFLIVLVLAFSLSAQFSFGKNAVSYDRYVYSTEDDTTGATSSYYPDSTGYNTTVDNKHYYNAKVYVKATTLDSSAKVALQGRINGKWVTITNFPTFAIASTTIDTVGLQSVTGTTTFNKYVTIASADVDYVLETEDVLYEKLRAYVYDANAADVIYVRTILFNKP